jgi:hypothetical protein
MKQNLPLRKDLKARIHIKHKTISKHKDNHWHFATPLIGIHYVFHKKKLTNIRNGHIKLLEKTTY